MRLLGLCLALCSACGPKGSAHTQHAEPSEAGAGATEPAGGSSTAGSPTSHGGKGQAGSSPATGGSGTTIDPGMLFDGIRVPGCEAFARPEISQVFYVDSLKGSDEADGDAPDQPFQSLERLKSLNLFPGDIVRLARGSRWNNGLELYAGGAQGQPISIEPYGEGEPPTISLPNAPGVSCVWIDAPYVQLLGIRVQGVVEDGIKLSENAHHGVVCGNELDDVGLGIITAGSDIQVLSNYAHDLHIVQSTPGGNDDYGAVGFVIMGGSRVEVAYNRCERCADDSLDYIVDGGAFETYGDVSDISIHHNYAVASNGLLELGAGTARNVVVAYNVSYNPTYGTQIGMNWDGKFIGDYQVSIENNTLVNMNSGVRDYEHVLGFWGEPPSAEKVLFRNNIVVAGTKLSNTATFTHDHNLYSFFEKGELGAPLGHNELVEDPQFADAASGNLTLGAKSSALDRADPAAFDFDLLGTQVPQNGAPDLGAYERK